MATARSGCFVAARRDCGHVWVLHVPVLQFEFRRRTLRSGRIRMAESLALFATHGLIYQPGFSKIMVELWLCYSQGLTGGNN